MNTEKHTVTIPIEDYNKLITSSKLEGLTKIEKDNPLYFQINESMKRSLSSSHHMSGEPIERFDFYLKLKA